MFSIRMRASKRTGTRGEGLGASQKLKAIHISGAEGIYGEQKISEICNEYIKRALSHSRGKPDEIVITIEKIEQKPKKIPLLTVTTLKCASPEEAKKIITQRLESLGISRRAIESGFVVLNSRRTMRGAALILAKSGKRVEPYRERGVRVSRIGIDKLTERNLLKELSRKKINTVNLIRVKEALAIASKAAFSPIVIAEICISDDPDYTTGYVASREFGYLRMPNIKKEKEMRGGRVFFIGESADVSGLISYLERKPVIVI